MIAPVIKRLFLLLAAFLVAMLPLEATYAASGCTPMAAMSADQGECGGCADHERTQCQISCIALCQSLPAPRLSVGVAPDTSSIIYAALRVTFPRVVNEGPDPPPPRNFR